MSNRKVIRTKLVEKKFEVRVYTCDRCGVETDEEEGWVGICLYYGQSGYDLCPDCYATVLEAMGIRELGGGE